MKTRWAFVAIFVIFVRVAIGAAVAAEKAKPGGTLTMGIRKDLTTMNAMVRTTSTDKSIRDLMYESLLGLDARGNIQPYLAEAWEMSADGKIYTFRLRNAVKFHDGREMTAEDVKYSIEYTMNPKNGATGLSRLSEVTRVETDGKDKIRIYLKKSSPVLLSYLSDIGSFPVIPKESLKDGVTKPEKYPAGTGPFRFVEWSPKQHIVFERFEDYWGHKAFVEKVILRIIGNSTVRFTAVRTGEVDIIERTPYEWVKQVTDGKIQGVKMVSARYASGRRLRLNVAAPPFDNRKLRQAIAHAIDKDQILKAAYFGFGEVTDQKYPKGHAWYFDDIPRWTHDLKKAKALVLESGYDGKTIPITVRQGDDQETEATVLQAQLKKIGMSLKLDVVDFGTYATRQRSGEYALMFGGIGLDPDPATSYVPDLLCDNPKKRTVNVEGYCDKEMDALLRKAENELDDKLRKSLFKKVVEKFARDIPFIPIGFGPRFFTIRYYVKGFTTDAEGQFRPFGGGLNHTWLDK